MSDRPSSSPTSRAAADDEAVVAAAAAQKRIPEATVLRLPIYQRILAELVRAGERTVSSERLAALARVNAAKVRKDLSLLGSFGTRGSGYDPDFLIAQIDRALGVDENWSVGIVGIGNLGRALTNSAGFASRGCQVTSLFDVDPAVVGEEIRGIKVRHMDELGRLRPVERPDIGVITTPGWAAQGVADLLVRAGVTSILNFAPRVLTVPPGIQLRYVDLSIELQVLGFYRARQDALERSGEPDGTRPEDEAPLMRSVGLSPGSELA
ncbi:MAG TPA: redox-sensing transcriptional repressor Rex [Acidimicrobiales bacterium]|nr:redox-sensing transcriptional repressor Rex [Acidimicrobiales bacterium]